MQMNESLQISFYEQRSVSANIPYLINLIIYFNY